MNFATYDLLATRDTAANRFFAQDANWTRQDGGRGPLRFHGGRHGSDFDFRTRGNNAVEALTSWVHSGYDGNDIFSPAAVGVLDGGIDNATGTIVLSAATGLANGEHIKINDEIILIGTVSGLTLSGCTRGQLGTDAASHNDGDSVFPELGPAGTGIWYAQGMAALFYDADQGAAASFAATSRDGDALALMAFARIDPLRPASNVWAEYLEVIRPVGTLGQGSGWAREAGVMNFAGNMEDLPDGTSRRGGRPYFQGWQGQTLIDLYQSGGANTNAFHGDNPWVVGASAGGAGFWRGAMFEFGTIFNPEGERAEAILFPEDYCLTWYSPSGDRVFDLYSSINSASLAQEFLFNNDGMIYRRRNQTAAMFRVRVIPTPANFIDIVPGATGAAPQIRADGLDTNVDLELYGHETGRIGLMSAVKRLFMDEPIHLRGYTIATLPAATQARGLIYVSDESGGATVAFSDGTNWRRLQDRAIVS